MYATAVNKILYARKNHGGAGVGGIDDIAGRYAMLKKMMSDNHDKAFHFTTVRGKIFKNGCCNAHQVCLIVVQCIQCKININIPVERYWDYDDEIRDICNRIGDLHGRIHPINIITDYGDHSDVLHAKEHDYSDKRDTYDVNSKIPAIPSVAP